MNTRKKILATIVVSLSMTHFMTHPMAVNFDPNAVKPVIEHVRTQLQGAVKSACKNLLYLGCGLSGLTILTKTIISKLKTSTESPEREKRSFRKRFLPYAIGIGSGIAFLTVGYLGLK